MFLIAITNSEIPKRFQPLTVEQISSNDFIITLVTDGFLSHTISTQKGFSIVESPLSPSRQLAAPDETILSRVDFDKHNKTIEIYKPTNSGRTVYYHTNQKGELYCSTHISLLRKAGVTIEEEEAVLPEYFVYGYVMPPSTLYKGIEEVLVGSRLCLELADGKCSIKSEDNLVIPEVNNELRSIDTIARRASDLLCKSIESLRPHSESISVPFSGGLDSSILYKVCKDLYDIDTTYSTGYPFEDVVGNIEKEYALSASKAMRTTHNYFEVIPKDYLEGIVEAIDAAEHPLAYTQSVMFYLLFRDGIPKGKNIVISGRGAESAFGVGLHHDIYKLTKMPWKLLSWRPFLRMIELASPLTRRGNGFAQNVRSVRDYPISNPNNVLWTSRAYASQEWLSRYFNVTNQDIINRRYEIIKPFEKRSIYEVISILDLLADAAETQSTWSKLGEKSGKILYHPFSDAGLLTYVYSVPWQIKFCPPKNILKHVAYQNGVPKFIVDRPKSGFAVQTWRKWVDLFTHLVPLCRKVFDENEILSLRPSEFKEAMTFWHMVNYSIWKRLFIHNESVGELLEELRSTTEAGYLHSYRKGNPSIAPKTRDERWFE